MRSIVIILALVLGGCATPYDPTPDIHDVADPVQVNKDVSVCAIYAHESRHPLEMSSVGVATGKGALGPPQAGVATLTGIGIGAGGGFLSAVFNWVGVLDTATPQAEQQCVRQRLDRDHAGILVEATL